MQLALENQYHVKVLCFEFESWSDKNNRELIITFPQVEFIILNAGRKPFIKWMLNSFREKVYRFLSNYFDLSNKALAQAISKRTHLMLTALKSIENVNCVIGHNPGALFATYEAGKIFNCPIAFDVEDFHPGEGFDVLQQKRILKMMQNLLPKFDYVSFSSAHIMRECKKVIKFTEYQHLFTIMNFFRSEEFELQTSQSSTQSEKLKLVWFSQNIDFNRGIENIVATVNKFHEKIECHLYGNLHPLFFEKILRNNSSIIIHKPLTQSDLHAALGEFDIGLAIEINKDFNRNIAITNKLLAYFQAGLYIIATNTEAQLDFLDQYPDHGLMIDESFNNFESILIKCINNVEEIRKKRIVRFETARSENWETASIQLKLSWAKLLS